MEILFVGLVAAFLFGLIGWSVKVEREVNQSRRRRYDSYLRLMASLPWRKK